ncbi:MAG: DedA family protein [Planctomycetes bacterium]|nr:DedA family protein [Planctomycetota bacterium]
MRWVFRRVRALYDWVLRWADTRYGSPALGILSFAEASFFPVPPDPLLMALALSKPRRAVGYATICSIASVLGGLFGYLIGFALWAPVGAPILHALGALNLEKCVEVRVESVEGDRIGIRTAPDDPVEIVHRYRMHANRPDPAHPGVDDPAEHEIPLRPGDRAYLIRDDYHVARAWYEVYGALILFAAAFTPIPYKVFTILGGLVRMHLVLFVAVSFVGRSARFFLVAGLIYLFGEKIKAFIDRYFNLLSILFVVLLIGGFIAIRYLV